MNKKEFLERLRKMLNNLPRREIEERISFYSEMIDDRIEEGNTEEDAVILIGSVEDVAEQVKSEISSSRIIEKESKRGGRPRPWVIISLILGAPLWIPLLLAAFIIALSLYIVLWSVVATVWIVELPLLIMSYISKGLFFLCMKMTKGSFVLTKKGALAGINIFKKKGEL